MEIVGIAPNLVQVLAWTMGLYVVLMFGISFYAQKRVESAEDFVVAGRRLSLPLATATLLATWFGAGTLMTATDEVRQRGVEAATLDPLGAGLCLLLVGAFFAAPLWKEKLITLPELFGRRYGPSTGVFSAALMIPPYLGWIAAQFIALAQILELFFGLPVGVGVALTAVVGLGYTLLGGMWAVTLTDTAQMILIAVGLVVMTAVVAGHMGDGSVAQGLTQIWEQTPEAKRALIPTEKLGAFMGWVGVLCAGSLGNIPSQDVMQRVFSARSASTARWACLIGGGLYIALGSVPVVLGLAGAALFSPEQTQATLPMLASLFLHPALAVLFVLTLLSAVLSTLDSALLAPGTVLARDLLARTKRFKPQNADSGGLGLVRLSVTLVAAVSLGLAYAGESAYSLLESGYELGMVSLMAPLTYAVYSKVTARTPALASMLSGTALWLIHAALGWEDFLNIEGFWVPMALVCTLVSYAAFPLAAKVSQRDAE